MKRFVTHKDGFEVIYHSDEKYFYIDSPLSVDPHFAETLRDIDSIIQYTKKSEAIVSIESASRYAAEGDIDRILIVTEKLKDYVPMIIMKSNHGLYDLEEANKIGDRFMNILNMPVDDLQSLYDNIVDGYQSFIDEVGYYFFDMSSNNLMYNDDFKFKIIDVLSIKKPDFESMLIDPVSVLFYHNVVKHKLKNSSMISKKCPKFYSFAKRYCDIDQTLSKLKKINPKRIHK